MEIKDSVAIVTGAAKRVGRVIALTLAEQGAHIAFTFRTKGGPWRETLAEIKAHGVEGLALRMDVRQPEQIESSMQEIIDHFGRVDILVNNASVFLSAPFLEITREQWDVDGLPGYELSYPYGGTSVSRKIDEPLQRTLRLRVTGAEGRYSDASVFLIVRPFSETPGPRPLLVRLNVSQNPVAPGVEVGFFAEVNTTVLTRS